MQSLGRAVEGRVHEAASEELRNVILPFMNGDEIAGLVRFDWLLISWGNTLCETHMDDFQEDMIKQKLRLAARLLFALKSDVPQVNDFASIYEVSLYNSVIDAIRKVGKLNLTLKKYESPSSAKALATLVKQIGLHLSSEYVMKRKFEEDEETERFLKLLERNIYRNIRKPVLRTQAQMRREKKENIPTTEDIKMLSDYLESERKTLHNRLAANYSEKDWIQLSEVIVASIIVYNRRRTGETQNTMISDFHNREKIKNGDEVLFNCLNEESKQAVQNISRMQIRGKLERQVTALLKPEIEDSLELLLRLRENVKNLVNNHKLFGLPSKTKAKSVDACRVLVKFSNKCGAKNPSSLRGTNMRKHMASMCISLELDDNHVSEVAKFMGHSEKVHRDFYRHNKIEREVVRMTQLLEVAQGNVPKSK